MLSILAVATLATMSIVLSCVLSVVLFSLPVVISRAHRISKESGEPFAQSMRQASLSMLGTAMGR